MKKKNRTVPFIPFICILFLLIFDSLSFGQQEKKYPPYPDVWGYEFPWPGKENRYVAMDIAKMPDGDYMVTYVKSWEEKVNKYEGILFFTGKKRNITRSDYNEFWKKNKEKVREGKVNFVNESIIAETSGCAASKCCPLWSHFITKKDKKDEFIVRTNLIYIVDKPVKIPVNLYCEHNNTLKKDYVNARALEIKDISYVPLEDGTFFVIDTWGNLIVRFDENLNTKSELLNSRVFLVDRKVIEDIRYELQKENKYNDQTLTDAIYEYVTDHKKEGKNEIYRRR